MFDIFKSVYIRFTCCVLKTVCRNDPLLVLHFVQRYSCFAFLAFVLFIIYNTLPQYYQKCFEGCRICRWLLKSAVVMVLCFNVRFSSQSGLVAGYPLPPCLLEQNLCILIRGRDLTFTGINHEAQGGRVPSEFGVGMPIQIVPPDFQKNTTRNSPKRHFNRKVQIYFLGRGFLDPSR